MIYVARLRPRDRGKGDMMASYTSVDGTVFQAEEGVPAQLRLIEDQSTIEELKAIGQFDIVEVRPQDDTADGQIAMMKEEVDRALAIIVELGNPSKAMAVLEDVVPKADLFARTLRSEADAMEEQIRAAHAAVQEKLTRRQADG